MGLCNIKLCRREEKRKEKRKKKKEKRKKKKEKEKKEEKERRKKKEPLFFSAPSDFQEPLSCLVPRRGRRVGEPPGL